MDSSNIEGTQFEGPRVLPPGPETARRGFGIETAQHVGHAAVAGDGIVLTNEIHIRGAISQLSGIGLLRVDAVVPRIH